MNKKFATTKQPKEQLDSMTSAEITDYRINFITKSDFEDETVSDYLLELDVYIEVRFKSEKYDLFNKWIAKAQENKSKGVVDDGISFMAGILAKIGHDKMYFMNLVQDLKKVTDFGEFQYIKGIEINIPDEHKDVYDFFKD